jgi:hypothetical protein
MIAIRMDQCEGNEADNDGQRDQGVPEQASEQSVAFLPFRVSLMVAGRSGVRCAFLL